MNSWLYRSLVIGLIEVFILLLAYFYFGSTAVPFFGALLFFFTGYFFSTRKNFLGVSIRFFSSVLFFIIIVFSDVIHHAVSWEEIRFLGFGLYFLIFLIAFAIGWLLKNTIRNSDIKTLVFYSLLGILITRVASIVNHPFSGSTAGIAYFCFGLLLFSKSKLNKLLIAFGLVLPFFLFYVGVSYISNGLWEVMLAVFLFVLIAVFLSFLLIKFKGSILFSKKNQIVFIVLFLIITGGNYIFMMNWTEYLYTRNTSLPADISFSDTFIDRDNNTITQEDLKGKIVVLDLWTTSCSVCFKKFPEFEKFYMKNKDRDDLLIYAVNLPYSILEMDKIESMINKFDYNFPFLISKNNFQYYRDRYNINGVPAIIILNKKGEMVYNSSLNNNPLVIVNNLQTLVDRELQLEESH